MKRLMILNGPNLNMLGIREPHIYGTTTLEQIRKSCEQQAKQLKLQLSFHQSNHEGELVELIQSARTSADAIIINPAGYGHTSVAILDSSLACPIPVIEVHLSNIHRREPYRNHSYVSKGATGIIMGLGAQGYVRAVDAVADILSAKGKKK